MNYAKIIDSGECYSTLNISVDGIPANRNQWAKYNFYPQNGMVGVLLSVNGYSILKIKDGIYVPMSQRGIVEISEAEYLSGVKNNVCSGMNEKQANINREYDGFQRANLPAYKELFKTDIRRNIARKTINHTINIYINDIIDEAVYYATDMCLEFYVKSGNYLPQNWIDHIVNETCAAFIDIFPIEFTTDLLNIVRNRVDEMLVNKNNARKCVDSYYRNVKENYVKYNV